MKRKEVDCKFIRIKPDQENFNIVKDINKIQRNIKKSSKEPTKESNKISLIDNLSRRLLN